MFSPKARSFSETDLCNIGSPGGQASETASPEMPLWGQEYVNQSLLQDRAPRTFMSLSDVNHLAIFMDDGSCFSASKILGQGVFGVVSEVDYFQNASHINFCKNGANHYNLSQPVPFPNERYVVKIFFRSISENLDQSITLVRKETDMLKIVYPEWDGQILSFCNNLSAGFIMPQQPGYDLAKYLKRDQPSLSWNLFLNIFDTILDIMKHLSELGVVHLDIKPANFTLSVIAGNFGQLKLLDFGIAEFEGAPIKRYVEQSVGVFPHLTSDRKFPPNTDEKTISKGERYTTAKKYHDYFGVGYLLEALIRKVNYANYSGEIVQEVMSSINQVRSHYDNRSNDRSIGFLLNTKTTLFSLQPSSAVASMKCSRQAGCV